MDTVRLSDPLAGLVLDGRYRLDRRIARGGNGTVYEGHDLRLDREVAVKVLHAWADGDSGEWLQTFTAEAKAAARLASPETVAIFDQGHDRASGHVFLVMELVRGRTLRDLLVEQGAQSPDRVVALLEPVLRAIAHAHRRGMVHRDVKPENVLLGDDGSVKVTDFGLARAIEGTGASSALVGTVAYLSPEQLDGRRAGPGADVYAAGILAFELLTGAPPWTGPPAQVIRHHTEDDVPAPSTYVSGVPAGLDALVVRATRRDPTARPVDGGAFLTELIRLRGTTGQQRTVARVPDGATRRLPVAPTGTHRIEHRAPTSELPRTRHRRRNALLSALVTLLLVGGGTGAWWLVEGRWHDVPGVLTLSPEQAQARLGQAGLSLTTDPVTVFDEQVAAGRIVAQDPSPGSRTTSGPVSVTLSKGPDRRTVPDLTGKSGDEAERTLDRLGLRVSATSEEFSSAARGSVVRTDPAPGTDLRPGAGVTVVLSKGVEQLDVPDVRGADQQSAKDQLSGLAVEVTEVFDDADPGTVVQQSPDAGATVDRGSRVLLTVSKGPDLVAVPDLVGQSMRDARNQLEKAGFTVTTRTLFFSDQVRSISPEAGTQARRGSTVTLYAY